MMKPLTLTEENFSDVQEELDRRLSGLNVDKKDILRAQLLVEEIFWRMVNTGNATQVDVTIKKNFFDKVQIRLTAEGVAYNPLVEVSDWTEDDDDSDSLPF